MPTSRREPTRPLIRALPFVGLVIRERTNMSDLFMVGEDDDRQPVDPAQFFALNQDVETVMRMAGMEGTQFVLNNQYYTEAARQFNEVLTDEDREQYARMAEGTGMSPFMVYVQKDLADYLQKRQSQ